MTEKAKLQINIRDHGDNESFQVSLHGDLPRYFNLSMFVHELEVVHEVKNQHGGFDPVKTIHLKLEEETPDESE